MFKRALPYITAALVLSLAGCTPKDEQNGAHERTVKDNGGSTATKVKGATIVDYGSKDPNQEPTLRVGGKFEIRTTNGGPVMLESQVDKQRRAAEIQRANKGETVVVPTETRPEK